MPRSQGESDEILESLVTDGSRRSKKKDPNVGKKEARGARRELTAGAAKLEVDDW